MFGPNKNQIKGVVNTSQKQQSAASGAANQTQSICAQHSVVKNVPAEPKKPYKNPKLTKEASRQHVTQNGVQKRYRTAQTIPELKRLAVKPSKQSTERVRTPYLNQSQPTRISVNPKIPQTHPKSVGSDLELAKSIAKELPKSRPLQPAKKTLEKNLNFEPAIKKKGMKRLFSLSRAELSVFAAGVFFASGLIVLGFYMGVSRPSVTAESGTQTYKVQLESTTNESSGASGEEVTVEVDEGIDLEDVDWRPPMPITAEMPSRLIIPKFNTNAPIRSLGLTRSGALAVPNYTNQVGWYDQSALPGNPGTVVMDGHYGIPAGSSVFGRFDELVLGDQFQIERGDSQVLSYVVEEIGSYPIGEVPMDRLIASDGEERLNLITCSGGWNEIERTYDHRTIVYTKRI